MPKSPVICSFHLTNSCRKGDKCSFSHAQQPQAPRVVCKHYRSGTCMFGNECRNSHDISEARTLSTEPSCVFWKQGTCSKGDQCPLMHGSPSDSTSTLWRKPQQSTVPRATTATLVPKTAPCIFWTSGHCTRGAQCRFSHAPLDSNLVSSQETLGLSTQFGRKLGSRPSDRVEYGVKIGSGGGNDESVKFRGAGGMYMQISDESIQPSQSKFPKTTPDKQIAHEVPNSSESTVERSFLDGVCALIGPGGIVQRVITAFESYRVTLSNVPHEASHEEIITIADAFGCLKSVTLNHPAPGTRRTAKLEYLDANSAKIAADTLDGVELHSRSLAAQLDLRSVGTGTADLRSSTLKMSWFAPARMAFAHYGSMFEAKSKASELNGRTIYGRKVATTFQLPSFSQRTSFTVIVKNLPLLVKYDELKDFCGGNSVDISQANYHGKDGIKKVQELLETFGPLESFDRSHTSSNDLKVKVLVRFIKPEHAAAAAEKLQGQSQSFLGGAKTWITLLHSVKYNIPKTHYRVLETDFRALRTDDVQGAKMRVYDKDEQGRAVDLVCIRIYGDDPKILGRLKTQIEALVSGEEMIHEGVTLWDAFFLSAGAKYFADEVQAQSGAFIRLDTRRRKIRVSGPSQCKDRARDLVLQKFRELQARRHQLTLTRPQLGRLLQGEFARLQEVLGGDKVSLDISNKLLVVRGDDEDIQAARLSLSSLQTTETSPTNRNDETSDCPVCLCEVTTPVRLACDHSYCFSCLRHYLASAENFPVKCLADDGKCNLLIPLSTISQMLCAEDDTKFFDNVFLAYIRQRPKEYHFCPSPDCQQIYRTADAGNILRCPSCLSRICPSCHVEFHEGLTCAEHQDDQVGDLLAYKKWKKENNVQSCPNCKVDIEKSAGCNHITCIHCGSHICWVCLKTWPDGSVIYEHMSSEHGGFGL